MLPRADTASASVRSCVPHGRCVWAGGVSPGWPSGIIFPAGLMERRAGSRGDPCPLRAWWAQPRSSHRAVARTWFPAPSEEQGTARAWARLPWGPEFEELPQAAAKGWEGLSWVSWGLSGLFSLWSMALSPYQVRAEEWAVCFSVDTPGASGWETASSTTKPVGTVHPQGSASPGLSPSRGVCSGLLNPCLSHLPPAARGVCAGWW